MEENLEVKFLAWGQLVIYSMKKDSKMSRIKKDYSKRVGISMENLKFSFNQNCIGGDATPEILGMKTYDTVHVTFIDEDFYLMEFEPQHYNDRDRVKMTYQAMLQMADLTSELLNVWKKREAAVRESETVEIKDFVPFHGMKKNLYQLPPKSKEKLVKYSVKKLLNIFGSEEEIERFRNCIFQVAKFIKMCLYNILEGLLPATLPYPVLKIITTNVVEMKGFDQIRQVTQQDLERKCMERLYFSLADIFTLLKVLMFNTDYQWHNGSTIYTLSVQKKEDLLDRLQVLRELLGRSVDGTNEDVLNESLVEDFSEDFILALHEGM